MDEVKKLIEQLKSESGTTRLIAAEQLGLIKDRRAVPELIRALKDESKIMRCYVTEALGEIGDASAVPHLIEALKDEGVNVRLEAAGALGNILEKCKTIEEFEKVENGMDGGSAALRKEKDKDVRITAQIEVAMLTREISKKKNELAPKRDLLLDDKTTPPKKGGGMYQAFRKGSSRRLMRT